MLGAVDDLAHHLFRTAEDRGQVALRPAACFEFLLENPSRRYRPRRSQILLHNLVPLMIVVDVENTQKLTLIVSLDRQGKAELLVQTDGSFASSAALTL